MLNPAASSLFGKGSPDENIGSVSTVVPKKFMSTVAWPTVHIRISSGLMLIFSLSGCFGYLKKSFKLRQSIILKNFEILKKEGFDTCCCISDIIDVFFRLCYALFEK